MTLQAVAEERLRRQCLTGAPFKHAADLVAWLGAVQAQEYHWAKWGLALRMSTAAESALDEAVASGAILRTHVMRPTWHFVAPGDIRWLLALTGPRVLKAMASYSLKNGLDPGRVTRALRVIERVLPGRSLTRPALGTALAGAGIPLKGVPLALLTMRAEAEALICSGPFEGRQPTYALLDERVPPTAPLSHDEALGELARRFFRSHGPATLRDFAWWSGLTMADGRRGLDICRGDRREVDGLTYWTVGPPRRLRPAPPKTHLLPIYDESLVAYRDRAAVPHIWAGPFLNALILGTQLAGTWKVERTGTPVRLSVTHIGPLARTHVAALRTVTARYGRFSGADAIELVTRRASPAAGS